MSDIKVTTDSGKFIAGARTDSGDHVGDLYVYHNGTNSFVENETGILYVTNKANTSLILGTNNTTAVTIDNSQKASFAKPVSIIGAQAYASSATNLSESVSKMALRVQGSSDASTSLWMGALTNDAQQYIQSCNSAGDGADEIILNPFGGKVGVGVGNASPTALFEVKTDDENIARFDGLQGNIDFRYGSDIEFDRAGQVYITANNASGELNFRTGGQNTAMHIDSTQNIGIGTDSPTTFHATLTGVQIGGNAILQHETSAGAGKTFKIAQNVREEITSGDFTYISTDEASFIELSGGGVNIKTAPSGSADATATMTSRFTVLQDGKVGIGESSPLATLHVKEGDSGIPEPLNSSGTNLFLEASGSNGAGMTIASGNTSNGFIIFGDGDSNFQGAIQYDHSASKMHLTTVGSQRMTIDSSGFVGIGDTSPDAHLEVSNETVDNDGSSYTGFFSNHIITAGSSDASDTYFGIRNHLEHNQSGQGYGSMYGIYNNNQCALAAGQMTQVTGISNNNSFEAGDVDYMRGILNFNNFDGGTIDNNIVTLYNLTEIASGGTITGSVYAIENDYDADTNPGGMMLGYYGIGGSNNDYHISTYSHTQSSLTFRLGDNGSIEHEQGISSNQSLDYAEYFESKDGKAIAIGTTVKLDNGKIVACEDGDTPIGVVRPVNTSAVVGGKQAFHWQGMYETDDYGGYVMESFTMTKWEKEVDYDIYKSTNIGDGGVLGGTVKKECYEQKDGSKKYEIIYKFHTDRIPSDLTVPNDARIVEDKNKRKKINSDYDHSKSDSYKDREQRDEWHIVGLFGQIQITKGQPLASNWIKMKDISDTVELYFVK
jgi:hypothetical protein